MTETATLTLSDFLLERIAADAAAALAATHGPWFANGDSVATAPETHGWVDGKHVVHASFEDNGGANAEHIARHDPARVLAECEAHRRIVENYAEIDPECRMSWDESPMGGYGEGLLFAVQCLALPYADHPAFRPEWKP